MQIDRVEVPRCGIGEGAVWDAEERAIYYLDIFAGKVFRHDPQGAALCSWDTQGHVGALGLRAGGGAVLAMTDTLCALDFEGGAIRKLAGPVFASPDVTVNDGAVDRRGRFVFGGCSAGMDNPRPIGGLFSLDAGHHVRQLDGGIHQSNSHCFSPDGRTLYCSDSFTFTTYAYDYDLDTGVVLGKRVFANTEALGGRPDGSAVDADGVVWISIFEGAKIAAYGADGALVRVIDMPARLISSVAFGGPDLDRLFVTTIDPGQFGWPAEEAGGFLYVVDGLGARGVSEARFAG